MCVFSRNCEDRSQAFPDVATAIRTAAEGVLLPSQVISHSTRYKRRVAATILVKEWILAEKWAWGYTWIPLLTEIFPGLSGLFSGCQLQCRRLQGGGAGR